MLAYGAHVGFQPAGMNRRESRNKNLAEDYTFRTVGPGFRKLVQAASEPMLLKLSLI
jgi:hypothetical protein